MGRAEVLADLLQHALLRGGQLEGQERGELEPERAADELAAVFRDWQSASQAPLSPLRWEPGSSPVEQVVRIRTGELNEDAV